MNMMKKAQQGFTLIELMIVVAIIGILAAIALPAYQDYTKRAHVSEGLTLAGGAKTSITEYYASKGEWPDSASDAGISGTITGNAVSSVKVTADTGVITITYNTKADSGKTVKMTPTNAAGSIKWDCTGGDMPDKYRPANCR